MLERRSVGDLPAKAHTALRAAKSGALRYEECITRAGFDGPYSIVYHEGRPHEAEPIGATHGWELLAGRPREGASGWVPRVVGSSAGGARGARSSDIIPVASRCFNGAARRSTRAC